VFEGKVIKVNFDIPLKCIRNGNRAVFIEVSKSNWVSVTDLAEGPPSPPYFGLKKKKMGAFAESWNASIRLWWE